MTAEHNMGRILADLSKPSHDQLLAIIADLQAKNAELAKAKAGKVTFRVNDGLNEDGTKQAGGISIFGMGRRPLTAYASQWLKVLDHADELRAFIETNRSRLSWKD